MYSTVNNYYKIREDVFNKIQSSSTITKVVMALFMACFTGIMAQIMIPLPWTPVPITGQTFAVLVAGLFLGKKYGALSQILYIILGVAFIPWFGGMTGGIEVLLGSTVGYFLGFILASYFIGSISEKYAKSRNFAKMTAVVGIGNFALIYIPGLTGLAIWSFITQGIVLSPLELIIMGLAPFIIGDIVKIISTGMVSKVFLPKN
ncbi:biotin transporter BioY [Methanobrevibacter sp. OttesenSCG-928-K11]|nr:biotin transporter BioY [Methanobrevibacter sp. OttesenSCG-928-K11]MDL2270665.1 biotin transporter BioY [Methanobrevibacter sp. OttesenSCG-928-I08]